jgi:putative FmdB family regulatory protein
MPLYEYACDKCGNRFEVMQKFADEPLSTHEACGGAVHRLISAPALQFKGSGWYVNDYAKGGSKSGSAENGSSAKSDTPGTTSSTKSETPASSPSSSESKSTSSDTKAKS